MFVRHFFAESLRDHFLPIELAIFFDAGVARFGEEKPSFLIGGHRKPVTSYSAMARTSFLGYLVQEIDYVKSIDRLTQKHAGSSIFPRDSDTGLNSEGKSEGF